MANYYEILKISPTSGAAEIEAAWDDRYNQVRRLVTHHDQKVRNQADQALALLEQIRSTLMDQDRRAVYDAAIGLGDQQIGGLADLDALHEQVEKGGTPLVGVMAPLPYQPKGQNATLPQTIQRVDAWICPKCQTANAVGVQFCAKCGNQIAASCPNCSKLTELGNPYCPFCGGNKEQAFLAKQTNEIKQLQERISLHRQRISAIKRVSSNIFNFQKSDRALRTEIDGKVGCLSYLIASIAAPTVFLIIYSIDPQSTIGLIFASVFALAIYIYSIVYFRKKITNKLIEEQNYNIKELEQRIKTIQATPYNSN